MARRHRSGPSERDGGIVNDRAVGAMLARAHQLVEAYKGDTAAVEEWLIETAQRCAHPGLAGGPPPPGGELGTRGFTELAEWIAARVPRRRVPDSILRGLDRAIRGRRACHDCHRSLADRQRRADGLRAPRQGPRGAAEADGSHLYFIAMLENVRALLHSCSEHPALGPAVDWAPLPPPPTRALAQASARAPTPPAKQHVTFAMIASSTQQPVDASSPPADDAKYTAPSREVDDNATDKNSKRCCYRALPALL